MVLDIEPRYDYNQWKPCERTPEALADHPFSPCRPASPKRSYKDLFSSSDRTYIHSLLPQKGKSRDANIMQAAITHKEYNQPRITQMQ